MARILVVVRHAKSDWSEPVADEERPLAPRGRRQAPHVGLWIAANLEAPALALVSPARRARQTWEIAAGELPSPPTVRIEAAAYTFSGDALAELVSELPPAASPVVLVGHNPAAEELIAALSGQWVRMPTAALAVVALPSWTARRGRLLAAGRPADGPVPIRGD